MTREMASFKIQSYVNANKIVRFPLQDFMQMPAGMNDRQKFHNGKRQAPGGPPASI